MRIPLRRRPNIIRLTVPPPPGVPHGDGWGLGERLIAPDKLLSEQNPIANELRGCGLSRMEYTAYKSRALPLYIYPQHLSVRCEIAF